MAHWQDTVPFWATAWAAVRDQRATADGAGAVIGPAGDPGHREYIFAWPGPDADRAAENLRQHPGAVLTLVYGGSGDEVLEYAAGRGLAPVEHAVLLTAPTDELNTAPALPENAELAQAPLELYDLVEISLFDHPVASGRVRVEEDLAVIGALAAEEPASGQAFEPAVVAALADEAFVHGADVLYTIVDRQQLARYTASGWTAAARIVRLSATT